MQISIFFKEFYGYQSWSVVCNLVMPLGCTSDASCLDMVLTLSNGSSLSLQENNPYLGIDCNDVGTSNMQEQNVFETLIGKQQQIMLATQVVKMILKIDDVITPSEF